MNSTPAQSPRPSSASDRPLPASQETPREPKADTARKQVELRSARERFTAKLDQNTGKGASAAEKTEGRNETGPENRVLKREQEDGSGNAGHHGGDAKSDHGQSQAMSSLLAQTSSVSVATPVTPLSVLDNTALERMAAHIAESWPTAGQQLVTIVFPGGSLAQTAHILREPSGSLSLRIAGVDPKLSALHTAQLHLQLSAALNRRRLKVQSLYLESARHPPGARGGGPAPGEASAMPRAV